MNQSPSPVNRIQTLECLDSDERALENRRQLELSPERAIRLGSGAARAIRLGFYELDDGTRVDWKGEVASCVGAKVSLPPDSRLPARAGRVAVGITRVQVSNESTLAAASRLHRSGARFLVLSFANGNSPGGGFLSGACSQEETLCRSSALYATLDGDRMYAAHRARPRPDATDWAILSPRVPVFRTDDGTTVRWWPMDVLTCAAPYAPSVGPQKSAELLRARIRRVLAIASAYGYDTLVLGAWGCGALGNEPRQTAQDFCDALRGEFRGAFTDVHFAIADWSPERRFLAPFRDVFRAASEA